MTKARAHALRTKNVAELQSELVGFKSALMTARVQDVAKGQQQGQKTGVIREIRKNIARALTVFNEKRRTAAKKSFAGKKWVPKEMRPKLTRALRRALTPEQKALKTPSLEKKAKNFPQRKFVVLA